MDNHEYEDGVRDGKIATLEQVLKNHESRMDSHERRLNLLEKTSFALFGAIALAEFLPSLKNLIQGG